MRDDATRRVGGCDPAEVVRWVDVLVDRLALLTDAYRLRPDAPHA